MPKRRSRKSKSRMRRYERILELVDVYAKKKLKTSTLRFAEGYASFCKTRTFRFGGWSLLSSIMPTGGCGYDWAQKGSPGSQEDLRGCWDIRELIISCRSGYPYSSLLWCLSEGLYRCFRCAHEMPRHPHRRQRRGCSHLYADPMSSPDGRWH